MIPPTSDEIVGTPSIIASATEFEEFSIDDEQTNVVLIKSLFSDEDYDISVAVDGQEGLDAAKTLMPDLILLDVMMPGMDGPTTLGSIREMTNFRATPIIFMTAKVMESDRNLYRSLGAAGIIAKPFDPMALSSQIRDIWQEHHDKQR